MKIRRTVHEYNGIQRTLAAVVAWAYILCLCPPVSAQEVPKRFSKTSKSEVFVSSGQKSSAVISAEHGGTVKLGRVSIDIPAGALDADTEISITRLGRVAGSDGTLRNATEGGGGYRFLPAGQKFKKEVFITIPYETAGTDSISTYYYDTNAGLWRELESVCLDRGERLATCASTHFTDMINATLAPPEAANPLELNINSIKGLDAADPLCGMIKMSAPQGNSVGDASFSLSLQIPAGRRGMQPDVTIAYSSGGTNGTLGKGFSLRCGSSITTDTRVGLPKYDGHDVYLKDGAELSLYDENSDEQEYTALSEGAFEKIIRHDLSGGDWWEVTSKNGTRQLYGMRSGNKTDTASRSGYTKEGKFCTYSWNLTEEIDAYGNSVSYYYDNDGGIPYIREIKYTGMNGNGGAYSVCMSYEARQDIILDARGRYLTRQGKRLSSIEALSGDTVLRKYEFGYTNGISGASLLSSFTVRNGSGQSYTYRFDHHGLEKDGQGRNIYFARAAEWENGRAISEGLSFGSGITVSGSGGIGIGGKSLDAHVSGSVTASSSDGTGWTESTLADMDGDGRADAVTQDGSVLSIYRNTGTGFEPSPVTVNAAAPHIDLEDSDTSGFGWSATGGMGAKASYIGADAKVSVAESNQNGTSEYTCMLCDADGDGRTDILITGRDTYLRNTGEGGSISFAPAKLNINGKIKNAQRTLTAKEKKGYGESFFEQTPFRAWKAPYSGIIYIEEKARRIDTESHTGSLYARTYAGDSAADEAELRLDLTKGGVQSSSGKIQVTQDGYAWLVLDTVGEPDGTDCEWEADILYSSVQPFSLSSGLPVPAGQGNAGSLIEAGKFLPGRINEKQMKSLVSELTPIIKAKAASSTSQSQTVERFWQKLADLYTYDGTTHEFIIRNGVSRTEAENVLTEYFSGSTAGEIKKASLEKLSVFGIKPEWKDGELSYMAEGSVSVSKEPLTGVTSFANIGGKTVTVKGGKVYEDGEESPSYTAFVTDGKTVLIGNGFKLECEGSSCTITYNTDSYYPADKNGDIQIPEFSSGGIAFRKVKLGTWSSREDFSAEDLSTSYMLYTGDNDSVEVQPSSPLYGGAGNWYYGIWKGTLSDSPFDGSAVTACTDVRNIDADALEENLSPSENADGSKSYDYNDLTETARKNRSKWYRPFLHNGAVAGTEAVSPVQDLGADGKISTHTEYSRPYITALAIHAERAGGRAYYNIEGIRKSSADGGSMSVPVIRKTVTSGSDITVSGGIGMSGFSGTDNFIDGGGGHSGGVNVGINESDAEILQMMQDVTGDGIPDIIRPNGGSLEVIRGSRERDSWNITFDAENPVTVSADRVSHSHTKVVTHGATVSASGSVTVRPGKNSKDVKIIQSASASAGLDGGMSFSEGQTDEDSGFIDLNGDGIADRLDGGIVRLGLGDSQTGTVPYFSGLPLLNKSSSITSGINYSLGIGGSGSADLTSNLSLSTGLSGGIGANASMSASYSTQMMLDINGDGLQDIVTCDGGNYAVRYNMGSSFSQAQEIVVPSWGALAPGGDLTPQDSWDNGIDVIGGLLSSSPIVDAPSYSESPDWTLTKTVSVSGNIGASLDLPIPLFEEVYLHINGGIGGTVNASASATAAQVRMADLDGDGLADQVLTTGSGMWWKRNLAGTADLVSKVHYPWGGTCSINYDLVLGTVDSPHARYCMTECILDDGCTGITKCLHSIRTRFAYSDAYFERLHRDSYGYGTVEAFRDDGSVTKTEYANREFYSRYVPVHTLTYGKRISDGLNELLAESTVTLRPSPYAQPVMEESIQHGSSGGKSAVRTEYAYGDYGNVTHITQTPLRNGTPDSDMTLSADIEWNDSKSRYLHSLPTSIEVSEGDGTLLRKRTGSYDDYGALTSLNQYHKEDESADYLYTYDTYGNMTSVTDGLGISTEYTYDTVLHQYPLSTVRSGGGISYTSSAEWNTVTGSKTSETDINGNKMSYTYDGWQRVATVMSPYDTGSVPAVSYSYGIDGAGRWYAVTDNKVSFNASDKNVIKTVIQADGLGRVLRTAKTGEVYDRASDIKRTGWNVSGAVEYDAMGRIASQGQPYFIEGGFTALALDSGIFTVPTVRPTLTEYDSLDRVIRTELPDGSVQTVEYDVTASGEPCTKTTDPLGNKSLQQTDPAGNIIYVERLDSSENSLTSATYTYNAIGEMLKATDVKGNDIKASYDMLGRKLTLSSMDGGRREYKYDAYRLVEENSPNLRKRGQWIGYEYDGLNRLVKIDYPETADTVYTYGNSGAANNSAGKVTQMTDSSGTIKYKYGKLGETTEETRSLSVKNGTVGETMTATMGYVSNYLGQMEQVMYPDGETVGYGYDASGQVTSVTGNHYGHDFVYVSDIGYDEFGQRTYIRYGTGVRTDYEYDENRRWLCSIGTSKNQTKYQNISYSFDLVGNVLGYTNDCSSGGGYKTTQTYSYDSLYQLINASGSTRYEPVTGGVVPEHESTYTQNFTFDILGNMTTKTSTETVYPEKTIGDALNYSIDFSYAEGFAHRLDHAGQRYYSYDDDGNVVRERNEAMPDSSGTDTGSDDDEWDDWDDWDDDWGDGQGEAGFGFGMGGGGSGSGNDGTESGNLQATVYERIYEWDERDRLTGSTEGNTVVGYVYGEDGNRTNKYSSIGETLYFSSMWTWHDAKSLGSGGQTTKNIYLGTERIVSKLNRGDGLDTYSEEYHKTYYWHSDHLGSAHFITDYQGNEYQRIEYTPYGEEWVELKADSGDQYMPYKFTGKEHDEETGLYYYGARYLDPKFSIWMSTDPALGEYMSGSDIGCGGIYNSINLNLYHYANNNPLRYTDPTGAFDWETNTIQSGDTLSQIAQDCNTRYGTNYTADDLQGLNSDTISDKDKIYAGNHLNLGKAEDVQKRAADYTSRVTTQYSNEQVTPSPLTTLNTNSGQSKAKIASTLGDIAAVLSVANAICFFVFPAACPFITATCFAFDAVSAGLYMSEGDSKSAALAMTSVALDSFGLASSIKPIARMIPSQVRLGYNSGAHRFIQGNGRFIKTAVGVGVYMMEDVLIPGGLYIYGKTSGN